ncbi:MAG: hypothetical protein Q7R82_00260 [Candidatus Daviesbacteria bacterium]|nr:hypothetical protein [Candidatus Daviesbacteria bacterium]
MIRLLPFILIPVLIIAGLGYWRFVVSKPSVTTASPVSSQVQDSELVEVPKTLPQATVEDRVKSLEDTITKLVPQVNSLKSSSTETLVSGSLDSRLTNVESAVTDLRARVSALEKATPTTVSSGSKSPLYIPLGASGGPWSDSNWYTLNEYQASINPDNYSGYSSMQLEVNFRMGESGNTGSARLYNVTDSGAVSSSDVSTTSSNFGLQTSSTFKLPGGQKTYTIQIKSSTGKELFVQSARIKVSF